jgi:cell wall-associated NlpC family hydrolase
MDEIEREQRERVVAEARAWIGTPYHSGQRVRGAGVDCAQLPAAVYHAAGMVTEIPVTHYSPQFHLHRSEELYLAEVLGHAVELPAEATPQPGDFVLWKVGRVFAHGAIVVAWPTIIHSVMGLGVVLDDAGQKSRLFWDDALGWRERRAFTLWALAPAAGRAGAQSDEIGREAVEEG